MIQKTARSRSVKSRMFGSYVMVLLVALVVGVFGYAWSSYIVRRNAETAYSQLLDQARVQVEQNIADMDRVAEALAQSTWVQEITNMSGPTIDRKRISMADQANDATQLQNYLATNSFYDRIALVFNDKDAVMTNRQVQSISWYFNHLYVSATYPEETMTQLIGQYTDGIVLPVDDVATASSNSQSPKMDHFRLLTYIRTIPSIDNVPRATLLISIREETILSLLSPVSGIEGASVYVVDAEDRIVTSTGADPRATAALRDLLLGRAAHPKDYVVTSDGRRMLVFQSDPSKRTGPWTYVALIPQSVVLEDVNLLLYYTLLILLVSLLVGLLLSYALLRRNYRPLSSVLDRVRLAAGTDSLDGRGSDEYGQIESAIETMAKHQGDLEERMGRFLPLAVHGFFLRLLYGNIEPEEFDSVENAIGIGIDSGPWTVAVFGQEEGEERANGTFRRKISQWETGDNRPVYTVETDQGRIAALMFTDDEKTVLQVVERLRVSFHDSPEHPLLVGVGSPCASLREIGDSYREAVMASHYARISRRADGRPVFFSEINQDGKLEYNLPTAMEDELRNRLRMGDCTRALGILEELEQMNLRALGSSLFTAHCFYYNLLSNALKVISEAGLPILGLANERHFLLMESVPDMKRFIHELYARICEALGTQREGRRLRIRTDILEYMEKNLNDENLTLAALADRFDVSVPYLSKFIKDQTGENFVDYIARKRVAFAKTLLSTTPQSIEEIGRRVGYSNPLTFRRAFRKVEGVTPGDFRDACRKPVSGS